MCKGSGDKVPRPKLEAPSGFEPEMEVLQTSALPLGDGALRTGQRAEGRTERYGTDCRLPTITLVGTTALDEPQVCVHDASAAFSTRMLGERLRAGGAGREGPA